MGEGVKGRERQRGSAGCASDGTNWMGGSLICKQIRYVHQKEHIITFKQIHTLDMRKQIKAKRLTAWGRRSNNSSSNSSSGSRIHYYSTDLAHSVIIISMVNGALACNELLLYRLMYGKGERKAPTTTTTKATATNPYCYINLPVQ